MTTRERKLRQCVLDESVYNALDLLRRDLMVTEIVNQLRVRWVPAWANVDEVVTVESVEQSARRLEALGLITLAGDMLRIPIRMRNGRAARAIKTDYEQARLSW